MCAERSPATVGRRPPRRSELAWSSGRARSRSRCARSHATVGRSGGLARLRFSSAKFAYRVSPSTCCQRATASSSFGSSLITGPKMPGPSPSSSTIVGTPNAPVRSTSPVCSASTASHVDGSSSAASQSDSSRPTSSSDSRIALAVSSGGGGSSQIRRPERGVERTDRLGACTVPDDDRGPQRRRRRGPRADADPGLRGGSPPRARTHPSRARSHRAAPDVWPTATSDSTRGTAGRSET